MRGLLGDGEKTHIWIIYGSWELFVWRNSCIHEPGLALVGDLGRQPGGDGSSWELQLREL
jgi:hypothetical protein